MKPKPHRQRYYRSSEERLMRDSFRAATARFSHKLSEGGFSGSSGAHAAQAGVAASC